MIKAIIFDWDGVIVDSMTWISKAIRDVFLSYGIERSSEEISNDYFQPRDAYYSKYGIDITDKEELDRRHKSSIKKHKIVDPLFPEVKEVLLFLKKNNFQIGVGSSTGSEEILRQLEFLDVKDVFPKELIFGGEESKEEKLRNFLKILNVQPSELLYVGNLSTDITTAQVVGVKSAGIERRKKAREKLALLNPDYLFSSLNDLKILLEKQPK